MINSPWQGAAFTPPSKLINSMLVISPIKGPANRRIIVDKAEPLCPPNVSIAPDNAAAASVVAASFKIDPRSSRDRLVVKFMKGDIAAGHHASGKVENIRPVLAPRGHPKAIGLVPSTGLVPPPEPPSYAGVMAIAASPRSVTASISGHRAEK